jgi:arylsulfatase A-like enzyme
MQNIVLITIDTLRKDHCGCYGYSRDTTPFIDKISSSGLKFDHSFANGPLTTRSFPSILCGQHIFYGKENNIHSYFLPKDVETIAQKLKNFGYYTAAFQAGNPFISAFYGYDRGFDFFEDFLKGSLECEKIERSVKQTPKKETMAKKILSKVRSFLDTFPKLKNVAKKGYQFYILLRDARKYLKKLSDNKIPFIRGDKLNEIISKWLNCYSKEKPLFLWVHYMDVHQPHIPKEDIAKSLNIPVYSDKIIARHWAEILSHQVKNSKQIRELMDLYDCEIRYEDKCIEELFDIFGNNNLTQKNTFFILTADHGEEFGEHGGLGHEMKLYNEMLSIPLIFVGNGAEEYKDFIDSLIELKSVPQVIVDVAKGQAATDISKEYVLSQSLRGDGGNWVRLIALQNREFKLIYDAGSEANNEFYSLGGDPSEMNNLIHYGPYREKIEEFTNLVQDFLWVTGNRTKLINMTKVKIRELKEKRKI